MKQVGNQKVNKTPDNKKTTTSRSLTYQHHENKKGRNKEEVQIAQSDRHHKHTFFEGTSNSSIKTVGENAWIYVTRLDKETIADQIQILLSAVCDVKCEKLNVRYNDKWSSFRICASFHFKDNITYGNIWHSGAQIGRYFFP